MMDAGADFTADGHAAMAIFHKTLTDLNMAARYGIFLCPPAFP